MSLKTASCIQIFDVGVYIVQQKLNKTLNFLIFSVFNCKIQKYLHVKRYNFENSNSLEV